eukprot:TRINITY_DN4319_c0_g2_i4.p1 TRINITY_DN4319_c0_g2~~TRINITY_DN4319_c0_g2_i4.p1  ORF type:complete len:434 (-),score=97.93 TRINITY_DN4319_c0_g2_i4:152-1453(-)
MSESKIRGESESPTPQLPASDRLLPTFCTSFAVGFGARATLKLLPPLIRLHRTRKDRSVRRVVALLLRILSQRESLRFGLFSAAFLTLYKGLGANQQWRQWMHATQNQTQASALLRGGVAGLSLVLAPVSMRVDLCLFVLVRALEASVRLAVEKGFLPSIPHADLLAMTVASTQIVWAWIFRPDILDPSYRRFIDAQNIKGSQVITGIRALHTNTHAVDIDALTKHCASHGRVFQHPHPRSACFILHPEHDSCVVGYASDIRISFFQSLRVYFPVYLVPLLLFRRSALLTTPTQQLAKTALKIVRSSLFLAVSSSSAWAAVCLARNVFGIRNQFIGVLCGIAPGLTLAIEEPSRRSELLMYTIMKAIETAQRWAVKSGSVHPFRYAEVFLFALSSAVFLAIYEVHPHLIRPAYKSALDYAFGKQRKSSEKEVE